MNTDRDSPRSGRKRSFSADAISPFDGYALGVYAALSAIGRNHSGSALQIEDQLREQFAALMNEPDMDYTGSGSITLRRAFDGDNCYGIELTLDLGTVYADEIEAWKAAQ